ncbi:oligosaccharide flippase family protein, partial [Candidatus Omnitrophota bacterium]
MTGNILARGTLYLIAAQVIFSACNYAIHFWLGRRLTPDIYGICGVVLSFLVVLSMPLQSGALKAVSKYTAENEKLAGQIKNTGIRFQVILALLIFAVFFPAADLIAKLLRDPGLTPYLRLVALFVPIYGIAAVYVGVLNGIRSFKEQAKTSVVYSVSRIAAVFIFIALGYKIYGLLGAYFLGAAISLFTARYYCNLKVSPAEGDFRLGRISSFAVPIILFTSALTLMVNLDLFFVKALLKDAAQTGFYTSASVLAKIPYIALSAFSVTLFPSIARSAASGKENIDLTRKYIRQSLRYISILLIPISLLVSATSGQIVSLIYTDRYLAACQPLSILIFGLTGLSVFIILTTIISASGRPI